MLDLMGYILSLVPRPSLTAFFTAVAKSVVFATAAKKAVREGLGTRLIYTARLTRETPAHACQRTFQSVLLVVFFQPGGIKHIPREREGRAECRQHCFCMKLLQTYMYITISYYMY